jgi:hypothetical protein
LELRWDHTGDRPAITVRFDPSATLLPVDARWDPVNLCLVLVPKGQAKAGDGPAAGSAAACAPDAAPLESKASSCTSSSASSQAASGSPEFRMPSALAAAAPVDLDLAEDAVMAGAPGN